MGRNALIGGTQRRRWNSLAERVSLERIEKLPKRSGAHTPRLRFWKPGHPLSSYFIAGVHACLGEKEASFEWLEKAFQEHESHLMELKVAAWSTLCTAIRGSTIW